MAENISNYSIIPLEGGDFYYIYRYSNSTHNYPKTNVRLTITSNDKIIASVGASSNSSTQCSFYFTIPPTDEERVLEFEVTYYIQETRENGSYNFTKTQKNTMGEITYINVVAGTSSTLYKGTTHLTRISVTKTTEDTPVSFNIRSKVSESIEYDVDEYIELISVGIYENDNGTFREEFEVSVPQGFPYNNVKIAVVGTTLSLSFDVTSGLLLLVDNGKYQYNIDNLQVTGNENLSRGVNIIINFISLYERLGRTNLYINNDFVNFDYQLANDYIIIGSYNLFIPYDYPKDVISIRLTDGVNTMDIPFKVNAYQSPKIIINSEGFDDEGSTQLDINVEYINIESWDLPIVNIDGLVTENGYTYTETPINNIINYSFIFDSTTYNKDISITFTGYGYKGEILTATYKTTQLVEDTDRTPQVSNVIVGQIWKDIKYNFNGDIAEFYMTNEDNEVIYRGRTYRRPNSNTNSIYINRIVENWLFTPNMNIDATSTIGGYNNFKLYDSNDTLLQEYWFINDWSYTDDFKTGYLSHPITNKPYIIRGQYAPFSLFADDEQRIFNFGFIKYDGEFDKKSVVLQNDLLHYWGKEVSEVEYDDRYFVIGKNKISFVDSCNSRYVLYYVNAWGGYDWFNHIAKYQITDNLETYEYTQDYDNTTIQFGKQRYLTEINKNITLTTKWLSNEESNRMWYLLESNKVYLHDLQENKIIPVTIKNTQVDYKQKTNGNKIIQYEIQLEYSQGRTRK